MYFVLSYNSVVAHYCYLLLLSGVIKLFSMLNSVEHGISDAHKHKNIKKFSFLTSDKPIMLFFPLIHVKKPTIVGILTFMSRKNFVLC